MVSFRVVERFREVRALEPSRSPSRSRACSCTSEVSLHLACSR